MLTWESYAILWTQTSPSDQASIVNAVLDHESLFANNVGNGTVISSGSGAQYIVMFQTNIPANIAPSSFVLPGGAGYALGPAPWTAPSSAASSYEISYAVFTWLFGFPVPGPGGVPLWLSGPQGNISQPTYTIPGYGGVNLFAEQGGLKFPEHLGWAPSILEIDTVGNYTLHFFNTGTENATGRVAMGYSSVVFSRSSPYLYAGATTTVIAAAFAVGTGLVSWRRFRHPAPSSESLRESLKLVGLMR